MKDENKAEEKREKGEAAEIEEKGQDGKEKKENKKGSKPKTVILAIVLIAIMGSLLYFFSISQNTGNPYQIKFANETLNFRANLDKAALVPAYPDEQSIRNAILSENVSRIKISYVPGEYNSFYAAASFEIAYKLVIIMKHNYGINGYLYAGEDNENCLFFEETGKRICIVSEPAESEDSLAANDLQKVIFMTAANETSVSLKGNIIYIKGKDFSEKNRKYTDLDLATDRLLLALMKE